jgi:septum formation protein
LTTPPAPEQNELFHKMVNKTLILASSSETRRRMLEAAGVSHETRAAGIDEPAIIAALQAEKARPLEIVDTLAEMKAAKVAGRFGDAAVIGSDQILVFDGQIWSKPETKEHARQQLLTLREKTHTLVSAVVVYDAGKPVWRTNAEAHLTMRPFSDLWLDGYLDRNWPEVQSCVGAYKIEEEGIRLFSDVKGDHHTILGLPLLPLLAYLDLRGWIER